MYEKWNIMPLFNVTCIACGNVFAYDTDKNATRVYIRKEKGAPQTYLIPCPVCGKTTEVEYIED
jgi:ribosomal protein S27E